MRKNTHTNKKQTYKSNCLAFITDQQK